MIKSSGMNVYPAQVEAQLYKHPAVKEVCIIGVPDEKQVERAMGFVVLNDPSQAEPGMAQELIDFCRQDLILWSCPWEIEFRDTLPLTLVGKVAFAELAAEEAAQKATKEDVPL